MIKKYIEVKPKDLSVGGYQRTLDHRRVEVEEIDDRIFGTPVVSVREDGTMYVIEGQHRVAFMIERGRGDEPIMVEAHDGLTTQEEAEMFEKIDRKRKGMCAYDRFRALVIARNLAALDIKRIVSAAGLVISTGKTGKAVAAVTCLQHAYQRGHLEDVLRVLTLWSDEAAVLDGKVMRAVSDFLTVHPEADLDRLAERLSHYWPGRVVTKIRMKHDMDRDRRRSQCAADVLLEIYNKGCGPKLSQKATA